MNKEILHFYFLIVFAFSIGACTIKPVEAVYQEKEDSTIFTTKSLKTENRNKVINIVAMKECYGKVICTDQDIKLKVIHADRFSFLKGKDFVITTEKGEIDLNERDYSTTFNNLEKSKDGTSSVLTEQYLVWFSESEFKKVAYAKTAEMEIGDYSFELSSENRIPWQILLDPELILGIMDKEQQREYGQYKHENKDKKRLDLRKKRMVAEAEEATWKMVKDSNNPEDINYFLEQFPESVYAVPAKLKLKQFEQEK